MEQVSDTSQSPGHVANRKTLICTLGLILFGIASAIRSNSAWSAQELGAVKVERKPKFISNGACQKPFEVTRHTVPLSEIQRRVPKDAIPALVYPKFVTAGEVGKLLNKNDRVLGVFLNGEAKAYPIRILNWHELVNDDVGSQPILVSW